MEGRAREELMGGRGGQARYKKLRILRRGKRGPFEGKEVRDTGMENCSPKQGKVVPTGEHNWDGPGR